MEDQIIRQLPSLLGQVPPPKLPVHYKVLRKVVLEKWTGRVGVRRVSSNYGVT